MCMCLEKASQVPNILKRRHRGSSCWARRDRSWSVRKEWLWQESCGNAPSEVHSLSRSALGTQMVVSTFKAAFKDLTCTVSIGFERWTYAVVRGKRRCSIANCRSWSCWRQGCDYVTFAVTMISSICMLTAVNMIYVSNSIHVRVTYNSRWRRIPTDVARWAHSIHHCHLRYFDTSWKTSEDLSEVSQVGQRRPRPRLESTQRASDQGNLYEFESWAKRKTASQWQSGPPLGVRQSARRSLDIQDRRSDRDANPRAASVCGR